MGLSRAEFARQIGCSRSWVTALAQAGRLVLEDDGSVNLDASRRRIEETADPNRDDVRDRHARRRSARAALPPGPANPPDDPTDHAAFTFADARARKEHYLALQAELEYHRLSGRVVWREDVEAALAEIVEFSRAQWETFHYRVAGLLVGKDLDSLTALLGEEVRATLERGHQEAGRQLDTLIQGAGRGGA